MSGFARLHRNTKTALLFSIFGYDESRIGAFGVYLLQFLASVRRAATDGFNIAISVCS